LRVLDYAREHRDRFVDELKALIRFPSTSAEPGHDAGVKRSARFGWQNTCALQVCRGPVYSRYRVDL
jgi:hypothetical protein